MRTDTPTTAELAQVIAAYAPESTTAEVLECAEAVLALVLERKRSAQNRRKRAERDRRRTRAAA